MVVHSAMGASTGWAQVSDWLAMCHFQKGKHYPCHHNVDIHRRTKHSFFSPWTSRDTCSQAGYLDCTLVSTEQFVNYNQTFVGATCPEMADG